MNIKISYNWLLEHIKTKASAEDIQQYLSLCGPSVESVVKKGNDWIFDIELTSNRADCASILGIARELSAILPRFNIAAEKINHPINSMQKNADITGTSLFIKDDLKLTKKIAAVVMENVFVGPSDKIIKQRLEACGIRSINNVVDISNYLMLELGHPVHIFDLDAVVTNTLIFRYARENERFTALDGKEYKLSPGDVIVDDSTGRIIDLPGIIGAYNTAVSKSTNRIIIFSQSNYPSVIRATTMRTGIRTMAATLNEKSPDPQLCSAVVQKGVDLIGANCQAVQKSKVYEISHIKSKKNNIEVSFSHIASIIGVEIPENDIMRILENLEFEIIKNTGKNIIISVPSFRYDDISTPEDIIEEIARIWGYHNLPCNIAQTAPIAQPESFTKKAGLVRKIKLLLKYWPANEVYNYSMIGSDDISNCGLDIKDHLKLSNTISREIEYMRISLIPSLLKNLTANIGFGNNIRLFEIANIYEKQKGDLPYEKTMLGLIFNTDYFDLKGAVEAVLEECNINAAFCPTKNQTIFAKNTQCEIFSSNQLLGTIGKINPAIAKKYNLSKAYGATLTIASLVDNYRPFVKYNKPNPYAEIKLDTTIDVHNRTYQQIYDLLSTSSPLIKQVYLTSIYERKYTFRLHFTRSDRNLTENEVKQELKRILVKIA